MHSHQHLWAASCSVAAMDQAKNSYVEGYCRVVVCRLDFGDQQCPAVQSKQIVLQQPWTLQAGARVKCAHGRAQNESSTASKRTCTGACYMGH